MQRPRYRRCIVAPSAMQDSRTTICLPNFLPAYSSLPGARFLHCTLRCPTERCSSWSCCPGLMRRAAHLTHCHHYALNGRMHRTCVFSCPSNYSHPWPYYVSDSKYVTSNSNEGLDEAPKGVLPMCGYARPSQSITKGFVIASEMVSV